MNGGKSTAESREPQQIFTIPEEIALATRIKDIVREGLDRWFNEFEKTIKEKSYPD